MAAGMRSLDNGYESYRRTRAVRTVWANQPARKRPFHSCQDGDETTQRMIDVVGGRAGNVVIGDMNAQ